MGVGHDSGSRDRSFHQWYLSLRNDSVLNAIMCCMNVYGAYGFTNRRSNSRHGDGRKLRLCTSIVPHCPSSLLHCPCSKYSASVWCLLRFSASCKPASIDGLLHICAFYTCSFLPMNYSDSLQSKMNVSEISSFMEVGMSCSN